MMKEEADCQQYKIRFIRDNGSKSDWHQVMPGSTGEAVVETVCR